MYLTVATTAAVFAFWATPALGWQPGERAAQRHCEHGRVLSCLHRAALHFRIDTGWLTRVAICESRLNPYARNPSGASGLMQFMPSTFASTRYGRHSIWSAKWSALAGALMFAEGQSGQWVCAG